MDTHRLHHGQFHECSGNSQLNIFNMKPLFPNFFLNFSAFLMENFSLKDQFRNFQETGARNRKWSFVARTEEHPPPPAL